MYKVHTSWSGWIPAFMKHFYQAHHGTRYINSHVKFFSWKRVSFIVCLMYTLYTRKVCIWRLILQVHNVGAILNKTVGCRYCQELSPTVIIVLFKIINTPLHVDDHFQPVFDDSWEVTLSSSFPWNHSILEILPNTLFPSHFFVIT